MAFIHSLTILEHISSVFYTVSTAPETQVTRIFKGQTGLKIECFTPRMQDLDPQMYDFLSKKKKGSEPIKSIFKKE